MKIETIYHETDLKEGRCRCCGERTQVVIKDNRCPECIEELKFIELTMTNLDEDDE